MSCRTVTSVAASIGICILVSVDDAQARLVSCTTYMWHRADNNNQSIVTPPVQK